MSVVKQLALGLSKGEDEISRFLLDAPKKYKVYTIPKRSSGHRVIAQPSRELKSYQRKYIELQSLPVHEAAMAYRKGRSIKDNAKKHRHNRYLLKIDLENFFNSISSDVFWLAWGQNYPLPSEDDMHSLERLLFWAPSKSSEGKLILSVGAPSSPLLSNFVMYRFDSMLHLMCLERGITYTRYADDLTFSTNHKHGLHDIPIVVTEELQRYFGSALRVNKRKTVFSSKAHNRHVTGITITNDGKISLGRERKRYIKHLVHQVQLDKLKPEELPHLRGLITFGQHIEPKFIQSLAKKYSADLIKRITEGLND